MVTIGRSMDKKPNIMSKYLVKISNCRNLIASILFVVFVSMTVIPNVLLSLVGYSGSISTILFGFKKIEAK